MHYCDNCHTSCSYEDASHSNRQVNLAIERISELEAELAKANESGEVLHAKYRELEAEKNQLASRLGSADAKLDQSVYVVTNLLSRLRQAKELIDEVASQCPEENDWLDVARRWLAAEIGGE